MRQRLIMTELRKQLSSSLIRYKIKCIMQFTDIQQQN